MKTILTSHLLPLQPPYPLVYIGEPYNQVCLQIATLLMPTEAESKDYQSIPVVDTGDYPPGLPYDPTLHPDGKVWPLNIRQGDQNIPWLKIVNIIIDCNIINLNCDKVDYNYKEIFEDFAQIIKDNGCTVTPPEMVRIEAEVNMDNDEFTKLKLICKEMNVCAELFPNMTNPKIKGFFQLIEDLRIILGDYMTELEINICTNKKPNEVTKKISEHLNFLWGVASGSFNELADYSEETIKRTLIDMRLDNNYTKNGKTTKKRILDHFHHKLDIDPFEFPQLWKILIDNKWVWYDEYSGIYKIVAE